MPSPWRDYQKMMLDFFRYIPFGIATAFIPFLLNLPAFWKAGTVSEHALNSLVFGSAICGFILLLFAVVYAGLTLIRIRTGVMPLRTRSGKLWFNLVIGFAGMTMAVWFLLDLSNRQAEKPARFSEFFTALLVGLFVGLLFFLHLAYRMAKEDALALQTVLAETRYQTLENQMQPHFLFNALNSLAELIETHNDAAADMTYKLADLYRRILANSRRKTASLATEVEIVRAYLELEQLRFGPRLRFTIEIPPQPEAIFLPSLVLQTLVENAVKHGIATSVAGGLIQVKVMATDHGSYHLTVENPGPSRSASTGTGTGLDNTKSRLDLLYGDRHGFALQTTKTGTTSAGFSFSGKQFD
ncbi:MAG: histidine kinase [Blastocatellia bacterium]|nr:histidine kinase [Blastocatellia bacterium]